MAKPGTFMTGDPQWSINGGTFRFIFSLAIGYQTVLSATFATASKQPRIEKIFTTCVKTKFITTKGETPCTLKPQYF
jgi:hypothetical protein